MAASAAGHRNRILFLLYCVSGFVGLGYQVAWFRIFADHFGSSSHTFAFVVGNFIAGLGAGSMASRRLTSWLAKISRRSDPLRLYGVIELLIAATAALTLLLELLPPDAWGTFPYTAVDSVYRSVAGYRWSHFAISTACVFVPCFLMGTTFPLLCSARREEARFPSALYGWNTLGACAGVLACEFVLLPWLGHDRSYVAMIVLNIGLGLVFLYGRLVAAPLEGAEPAPAAPAQALPAAVILTGAIAGGLLTGALEADAFQRLQFLDCRTGAAMSCISFWAILAIFAASWTVRALPRLRLLHVALGYGLALLSYFLLWCAAYPLREQVNAPALAAVRAAAPGQGVAAGEFQFFNFGYGLGSVLVFTGLFVFPACYLMSLLLPLLCNSVHAGRRHLGVCYGANTVAFCIGLLAFSVAAPSVNVFYALRLFFGVWAVVAGCLLLLAWLCRAPVWLHALAVTALATVCWLTPASFAAEYFPASSQAARYPVRAMRSNGAHTTFVVADPLGDLLFFDSHTMSGCNAVAQQYMRLMAHFPLLAQEAPRSALLICFGVGSTASAIASHESIQRLDIVDLNDQVFATAPEFATTNRNVTKDPRVRLIHDDGRRFLGLTGETYDLITSEPPPPMSSGVDRLYSVEYYRQTLARLSPGGMMSQWLPTDQMPLPAMNAAIASFVAVFPHALLFVGSGTNYILVGARAPIDLRTLERRFAGSAAVRADLRPFELQSPLQILARIVKCDATLRREFAAFPVVSDQHNCFSHVFHDAAAPPVITYDPVALLEQIDPGLQCREALRRTVLHLGRLKTTVVDFPVAALASVAWQRREGVAMALVDWHAIGRLLTGASSALTAREPQRAARYLQDVLVQAPEFPFALRWLGILLIEAQQFEPALAAWQRVADLQPESAEAQYSIGYLLGRLGRIEPAIAHVQKAVDLEPDQFLYRRGLGDALAAAQRWSDAIAAYDAALRLQPNDEATVSARNTCLQRR